MEGNVEELRELAEEEEGPEMCETPPAPPLLPLSPEDWRPLLLQYHRDGGALPTLLEEADLAATQLTQAVDAACARYLMTRDEVVGLDQALAEVEEVLGAAAGVVGGHALSLSQSSQSLTPPQALAHSLQLRGGARGEASQQLGAVRTAVAVGAEVETVLRAGKVDADYASALGVLEERLRALARLPPLLHLSPTLPHALTQERRRLEPLVRLTSDRVGGWLMRRLTHQAPTLEAWLQQRGPVQRYRPLVEFLSSHARATLREVVEGYVGAAGGVYAAHFAALVEQEGGLRGEGATEDDLLATTGQSTWRALFGASPALTERTNLYSLASRQALLQGLDQGVELPPSGRHPFELLFRSLHFHLISAALQEGRFCRAIWGATLTDRVMSRAASLLQSTLLGYVSSCHDVLALLVLGAMLQVHHELLLTLPEGGHLLRDHFTTLTLELGARATLVLGLHVASLDAATAPSLAPLDPRTPHWVTRRYAELSATLEVLQGTFPAAYPSPPWALPQAQLTLHSSFAALMKRLALSLPPAQAPLWTLTQTDLVLLVYQQRHLAPTLPLVKGWTEVHQGHVATWVQAQLDAALPALGRLLRTPSASEREATEALRLVGAHWRTHVITAGRELRRGCGNLDLARLLFERLLAALLAHTTRALELGPPPAVPPLLLPEMKAEMRLMLDRFLDPDPSPLPS